MSYQHVLDICAEYLPELWEVLENRDERFPSGHVAAILAAALQATAGFYEQGDRRHSLLTAAATLQQHA